MADMGDKRLLGKPYTRWKENKESKEKNYF